MRNIRVIFVREFRSYLHTPMAYVVAAVFVALGGVFFVSYLERTGYSDTSIRGFASAAQYLILFFSAVLTMRLVSEERKMGTWELLLTVPVADSEIILGKFFGGFAVLLSMLGLTLYFPLLLVLFGDPDIGPIVTSYVGLSLLGAAAIAIGIFASSITTNQLVAAVVSGGMLYGLWFLGVIAEFAPGATGELLEYISLSSHVPDLIRGVLNTEAVIYYTSVAAVFLYLSVRTTGAVRWR